MTVKIHTRKEYAEYVASGKERHHVRFYSINESAKHTKDLVDSLGFSESFVNLMYILTSHPEAHELYVTWPDD